MTKILALGNYFSTHDRHVLHGAATYARLHGWQLTPQHTAGDTRMTRIRGFDAVLVGTIENQLDLAITRSGLPVVGWSTVLEKTPWPRVLTDNRAVGRIIAETFLSSGYRHFAYFPDYPGMWSYRRKSAFVATVETAGHTVQTMPAPPRKVALNRIATWMDSLPRPLALMLSYDSPAELVISACRQLSLNVPEDVAIISVGNDELVCEITNPPISSVPQLTEQIGYQAASILDRLMRGARTVPEFTLIPPGQMVVRRSSDATAFDDPMVTEAMRFIREQPAGSIGVKQVLNHLQTSRMTLDKRFITATGGTVAVEIRRMRLDKAKQFLSSSSLSISAIARLTGFSSGRHFSKAFQRFTGETPTAHRNRSHTGNASHG